MFELRILRRCTSDGAFTDTLQFRYKGNRPPPPENYGWEDVPIVTVEKPTLSKRPSIDCLENADEH